jgi:hypothetical protein
MTVLRSVSWFLLVSVAALGGCVVPEKRVVVRPEAARVELVTGRPEGCQVVGDVSGSANVEGEKEQAMQEARNDVRNRAAAQGATHVELQTSNGEVLGGVWGPRYQVALMGVAYRCPK